MEKYTQISSFVLRDLLNCKTKLQDVRQFAEDYDDVLKEAVLYDELMAILNSTQYGEDEE